MDKISIYDQLNKIRLLVFLEIEPFTNKYHQVILDESQFKRVSDSLPYDSIKKTLLVSDEHYILPDLEQIEVAADMNANSSQIT